MTMKNEYNKMSRRSFLTSSAALTGTALWGQIARADVGTVLLPDSQRIPPAKPVDPVKKKHLAMVGLGNRGAGTWGRDVANKYSDYVEFVGICDINAGRMQTWQDYVGLTCPTYSDFEKMMQETKPDMLIVCTVDATHDYFIVRGMELGADVITE